MVPTLRECRFVTEIASHWLAGELAFILDCLLLLEEKAFLKKTIYYCTGVQR